MTYLKKCVFEFWYLFFFFIEESHFKSECVEINGSYLYGINLSEIDNLYNIIEQLYCDGGSHLLFHK